MRSLRQIIVVLNAVKLQVTYDYNDLDDRDWEINAVRVMDHETACPVDIFDVLDLEGLGGKIDEAIDKDVVERKKGV